MNVLSGGFWIALLQIVWVNILLSGDNAVVIALAARNLPSRQQKMAMMLGSGAAVVLLLLLTIFAVGLLQYPYLKLVGSVMLLWIGIQLLCAEEKGPEIKSSTSLLVAMRTILVADLVMSLDNVIAMAASAGGAPEQIRTLLLVLGLGVSVPLIIFGSTLVLKLMERFPVIILLGGALLGFVAGEMAVSDAAIHGWFEAHMHGFEYVVSIVCALLVVIIGKLVANRQNAAHL